MARHAHTSEAAQEHTGGTDSTDGRDYGHEPQRPDEGVAAPGGTGAAGREHPLAPEQVYERDVPLTGQTAPDPAPRPEEYGEQWGRTPLPVQEPADEPRGARTGAVVFLGLALLVLLVVLIVGLLHG
jgi:hypothetical protein